MRMKLSFIILCFFLLLGCQNETSDQRERQEENQFLQIENTNTNSNEERSNTEIANHLANVASNVPEVNGASALVAGPYTVVAIAVDDEIDRSRIGSIKYTVSEALYHDPWGKTAVVVADPDVMTRFKQIGERIEQGNPVEGLTDELAAIVGRVMPEFPVRHDGPQQDDNKEMLDDEEEKQLEKIQDEQSNHEG